MNFKILRLARVDLRDRFKESLNICLMADRSQGLKFYGDYSEGVHLFPFRTEQLSPSAPMVLQLNAGE